MTPHDPPCATTRARRPVRPARPARRPLRVVALLSAVAIALGGSLVAPAAAATTTGWAQWDELTGTSGSYTTTIAPLAGGFPAAQMSTDSRAGGVGVISGRSTWLSADTPVGQTYGSSRDQQYLNLRPRVDSATGASTTTYTFDTPTPAGGWTFALGDIDADQVQVAATDATGRLLTEEELGFRGGFNYCDPALTGKPSCTGAPDDVPSWDTTTQTLTGNTAAADTQGAAAWFEPSEGVSTLTLTFTRRAGFPVFQTWFAALARDVSGVVTDVTPGAEGPLGDVTLNLVGPQGQVLASTTSAADGSYSFEGYTAVAGYQVEVAEPDGKIAATPVRLPADLSVADATEVDFAVRDIVPAAVSGTVRDDTDLPLGGVSVTITTTDEELSTTTRSDGSYIFDSVPAGEHVLSVTTPDDYTVVSAPDPVVIPPDSEVPVTDQDFVLQPAAEVSLSGEVTVQGDPVPGAEITAEGPAGETAQTLTATDGTYTFADLAPGTWTVTVDPPAGYITVGPATREETVAGSDVTGVDFTLALLGAISGQVTTDDGTPVAGVELVADGPDGPTVVTTDESGGYAVDELQPGEHTVTITVPDDFTVQGETTLTTTITAAGEVVADQSFVLVAVVTPEPTDPPTIEPTDPPTVEPTDPTAPPTTDSPTTPAPGANPPGSPGPGGPGSGGGNPGAPGSGGGLPVTGGDPAAPLAVAALLVVLGVGALAVRRPSGARG